MSLAERRQYQEQERAFIRDADPELAEMLDAEPKCRGCGCSESLACPDGCGWAHADLCTECARDAASAFARLLAIQSRGVNLVADLPELTELATDLEHLGFKTVDDLPGLKALAEDAKTRVR